MLLLLVVLGVLLLLLFRFLCPLMAASPACLARPRSRMEVARAWSLLLMVVPAWLVSAWVVVVVVAVVVGMVRWVDLDLPWAC